MCVVYIISEDISQRRKPFCLPNDLKKAHQVRWYTHIYEEREREKVRVNDVKCTPLPSFTSRRCFKSTNFEDFVAFSFLTITSENRNVKNNGTNKD